MEQRRPYDKLGINVFQFVSKIHKPHVILFIQSLCNNPNHIYLAVDGATWHHGPDNKKFRKDCGYHQFLWPPNLPYLNPMENLWLPLKRWLKKHFSEQNHCPDTTSKLFLSAQEEQGVINHASVYDYIESIHCQIQAVIDAIGGHTNGSNVQGFLHVQCKSQVLILLFEILRVVRLNSLSSRC